MQAEEYNRRGKELVDYITQYLVSIRERKVIPDVAPDYMRQLIPDTAPVEAEDWESIFKDIERVIMPGVVHWQSPHMHAYYPCLTSWPSMLGEMLADAINCVGFTWAASPASTELEMNVMDWLCKALGLPNFFLHYHPDSRGGGILQSTVSESTLIALLAARKDKILELQAELDQEVDESVLNARLVAYASDQAHSSVEKAGLIALVKVRFLSTDDQFSLRGDTLKQAILEDRRNGLVPFMLCATLGTTAVCAFDKLSELGPVCQQEGLWLHVDAAYAGTAYFCPELRWSLEGIDLAHSFVFNPSKWMMVHFDCTAFWVRDKYKLQQTFSVDPVYLRHENSQAATDFMHWQIPLSRRFRSLKLWFVMRSFGLKKLQAHVRHGIEMAKLLESQIRSDPKFEVPAERHLGLVVFCLKGGNALTQELLKKITRAGTMYLIPAEINNKRIIRFTVTSQFTTADDILKDWGIISKMASALLADKPENNDKAVTVQPKPREDGASGEDDQNERGATFRLEESQWELLIKKDWNVSRKTQRSLSCSYDVWPGFKSDAAKPPQRPVKTGSSAGVKVTENPLGQEVLKKLTKFHSVPTFCHQLVQCGRQQMCFPKTPSQAAQENPSFRCMGAGVAPPTTPTEVHSAPKPQ